MGGIPGQRQVFEESERQRDGDEDGGKGGMGWIFLIISTGSESCKKQTPGYKCEGVYRLGKLRKEDPL